MAFYRTSLVVGRVVERQADARSDIEDVAGLNWLSDLTNLLHVGRGRRNHWSAENGIPFFTTLTADASVALKASTMSSVSLHV